MPKNGRGCQTRNNISHQILATAPDQSRDAHTITIGAFDAFVTFARLHGVTLGAGKMAKTKKTARELAAMVMREVRASGKCSDLQSVVVHPTGRNYPTWECATQVNKPDNPNYQLSAACRHTLDLIVGRLQSIYDLAG